MKKYMSIILKVDLKFNGFFLQQVFNIIVVLNFVLQTKLIYPKIFNIIQVTSFYKKI